jgi:UDP-2-acetamido-3-amino-2,3-dideoxy-glucuronate N-acetyltransferase
MHQFTNNALNFVDKTAEIGLNVSIWHWSVVLADVKIGDNVSIGSRAEIGKGSVIGPNTRISSGVFLPSNSVIGKNCFVGPNCTFTDDRVPKAGKDYYAQPPILEDGCSVGAGCTVLPNVRIGAGALVGAGSVVTKDVPPKGHVRGEPAREKAYSGVRLETFNELATPHAIEHYQKTGKLNVP